jgi:hypothetical protein
LSYQLFGMAKGIRLELQMNERSASFGRLKERTPVRHCHCQAKPRTLKIILFHGRFLQLFDEPAAVQLRTRPAMVHRPELHSFR